MFDEIKAFLNKIPALLYTPQVKHPALEEVRELIVAEIQTHMNSVLTAATQLGDNLLQGLEQALQPPGSTPAKK